MQSCLTGCPQKCALPVPVSKAKKNTIFSGCEARQYYILQFFKILCDIVEKPIYDVSMGQMKGHARMTVPMIKQLPLKFRASSKNDVRSQFAALCYRVTADKPEILMITSRGTGRWIIPKGWPEAGMTPANAALKEAWEEAGVTGKATDQCLGLFSYSKEMEPGVNYPCVAMVYPVKVKSLSKTYPEQGERRRKWMSQKKAAQRVSEPELARILRDFDPRFLR